MPSTGTAPGFEPAVEETERLLLRAVELRLQADVPVGALLSGGIDSALVCWAIARSGGKIKAFTVATPGDPWDESAEARATAQSLAIDHEVIELSPDDTPDLGELTTAYAEPFACASALGMLSVAKAVAQSATVLLTGDGGDDLFLGYPEHHHLWLAERIARRLPAPAAYGWRASRRRFPRAGALRRAASFLDYTTGGLAAVACARDGLPGYERRDLLGERLATTPLAHRTMPWSLQSGRRVLSDFLEYDRRTRFVGEYLPKVDGATMHFGLEARSPFLDTDLWEYAASLPLSLRLRGGHLKAVLRELARRRVGHRVAGGSKRGFRIPVQRWLVRNWRPLAEAYLGASVLAEGGWIRPAPARALLAEAIREDWAPLQLWRIVVLEAWMRAEKDALSMSMADQTVPRRVQQPLEVVGAACRTAPVVPGSTSGQPSAQ